MVTMVNLTIKTKVCVPTTVTAIVALFVLIDLRHLRGEVFLGNIGGVLTVAYSATAPSLGTIQGVLRDGNIFVMDISFRAFCGRSQSIVACGIGMGTVSSCAGLFGRVQDLNVIARVELVTWTVGPVLLSTFFLRYRPGLRQVFHENTSCGVLTCKQPIPIS